MDVSLTHILYTEAYFSFMTHNSNFVNVYTQISHQFENKFMELNAVVYFLSNVYTLEHGHSYVYFVFYSSHMT